MQFKSLVISNTEVSAGYFRMRFTAPPEITSSRPGQFVMLRVSESLDPLLRRPFGIFDLGTFETAYTDCGRQTFCEILYRVVGKGTGMLSGLHAGDRIEVLAPLGNGFDQRDPAEEKILVGGGIGLAPLYYLAKELVKSSRVRLYVGGRTRDDVLCITEFERLGVETYVSTDDGTLGERGLVTQVLEAHLAEVAKASIFACGPMPMLNAVAGIAGRKKIACQVSLEAHMACGMGACLGCVVPGKDHDEFHPDYRCVCKDGPVFDFEELKWI